MAKKRKPRKKIILNLPQVAAVLAPQKEKYMEWGAGTGKSTILAYEMINMVHELPRSKNGLVGASYKQILDTTLPSTIEGLELFGYKKDVHFTVGGRHPGAPEPFQPPQTYKHCIHWYTGGMYHLISQDRPDTGRGLNLWSIMGDEAGILNKEALDKDVITRNRAGQNHYPNHPKLNSVTFASTIPLTREGKWFLDMQEEALKDPKGIFHSRANCLHNIHNLRPDYVEYQRRLMLPHLFRVEVLNLRPTSVTDGFYPSLRPKEESGKPSHYYSKFNYDFINLENEKFNPQSLTCEGDGDHDPSKEMHVSIDWGARINSMVVAQKYPREIRVIKNFFVKHPDIIDHLVKAYCSYYSTHQRKVIRLYYDRSGNNKVANSKLTYVEQAKKEFERNGWTVHLMTSRGLDPYHRDKYLVWNVVLTEENNRMPVFRVNKHNCRELIISMENASAKEGKNGIEKDKRSERSKVIPQEEATHLSDAIDILVYNIIKPILNNRGEFMDVVHGR